MNPRLKNDPRCLDKFKDFVETHDKPFRDEIDKIPASQLFTYEERKAVFTKYYEPHQVTEKMNIWYDGGPIFSIGDESWMFYRSAAKNALVVTHAIGPFGTGQRTEYEVKV
ncbi:hypothetical protein [Gluconacetobacter tumulicola]|uniref:Uncharacterized protein n=1 Tax=Gluconacetobacter tumulicola TaxID=1017177 RepID=A0A7W4JH74_9PROT|nr:hypothetical protein [Gluconacetobacter tumulicola]MBB2181225.1 hypothetical protein [Gluconacetobacter tumulicola]